MQHPPDVLLPEPRLPPPLDPGFRPAALAVRAFARLCAGTRGAVPVGLALEQPGGAVASSSLAVLPAGHPAAFANLFFVERHCKQLLWAHGGARLHVQAPAAIVAALAAHCRDSATGRFDAVTVAERMFDQPLQVVAAPELPPAQSPSRPLGGQLRGRRIGFDLGGSDRKVAAVVDGEVVFTDETKWDPYFQPDPQYHRDGILDSLHKAAAVLGRVDAIGGSAAGVYVDNRVKISSLFRGVPAARTAEVRDLFVQIQQRFGVPLVVVNDGEVTALAGAMALRADGVLGLSLGTSTAAGYVGHGGGLGAGIDELAFAPIDFRPGAAVDEWSGDRGCAVQYLSQQPLQRLLPAAGIDVPAGMPLPERLELLQALQRRGDERAALVYETFGTWLGYAIAWFAGSYDLRHVLVLGRVTTGDGGGRMLAAASAVLAAEFPQLAAVRLSMPDEAQRRLGQAVAAASLPVL